MKSAKTFALAVITTARRKKWPHRSIVGSVHSGSTRRTAPVASSGRTSIPSVTASPMSAENTPARTPSAALSLSRPRTVSAFFCSCPGGIPRYRPTGCKPGHDGGRDLQASEAFRSAPDNRALQPHIERRSRSYGRLRSNPRGLPFAAIGRPPRRDRSPDHPAASRYQAMDAMP